MDDEVFCVGSDRDVPLSVGWWGELGAGVVQLPDRSNPAGCR